MNAIKNVAAFLAITIAASAASAAIVDFNAAPEGPNASYSAQGFTLTAAGSTQPFYFAQSNSCNPTCADNGTLFAGTLGTYFGEPYASTLSLKATSGAQFAFAGFDGVEFPFNNQLSQYAATGITVTGFRSNGTTVFQTFALDGINDGAGGVADFQTFSSNFTGSFLELQFTGVANASGGSDFGIDNINVSEVGSAAVPEPASIALLGLSLAGVAMARRRKV